MMKHKFLLTRDSARAAEVKSYTEEELAAAIPANGLTVEQLRNDRVEIPCNDIHFFLCFSVGAPDKILQEHGLWCIREHLDQEVRCGRASNWPLLEAISTARKYCHGRATVVELDHAQTIMLANGFKSCLFLRYSAPMFANETAWATWCLGNLSFVELINDLVDRLLEAEKRCCENNKPR